ncbi:MAG: hypothetical protein M3P34_03060, partial [Actinomycetota bacterium]|nr:hypothetical protein [Actinomycetota bacterium]
YHVVVDGSELPDQNKRNALRVMVEQLAGRGVPFAEIRAVLPERVMKVLPGRLSPDAVPGALASADPKADVGRWFCDHPVVDEETGETYVLFKMWGLNTEPTLSALAEAFPEAKVGFRRARARSER